MQAETSTVKQLKWVTPNSGLPNFPIINDAVKYLQRAVQAPYEMCLVAVLSAMSIAQQGLINVEQIHGGSCPSNLWIWITALSGERKSALMNLALEVLYRYQRQHRKKFEEELKSYQVLCEIHEDEKKHLKKEHRKALTSGDEELIEIARLCLTDHEEKKPVKPKSRDFIFEDIMPEALQYQLNQGPGNAAIISSEGGTIINGPVVRNLAFLSNTWSGGSFMVHRKSSDSYVVEDARLTLAIAAQPVALDNFMKKKGREAKDIGFFARCLFCFPQSEQGYRTASPNTSEFQEGRTRFNNRLNDIMDEYDEHLLLDKNDRYLVEFDKDCKPFAWELCLRIESELKPGGKYEHASEHASKLFENITRTAGNITYFEKGRGAKISRGILNEAARVCFNFSDHYLKYFQIQPEYIQDAAILHEHLLAQQEYGERYVAKTPIRKSGPYRLRNMTRLNRALEQLAEDGLIAVWKIVRTGFTYIDLNPNVPDDLTRWEEFCRKHKVSTLNWYEATVGGKVKELPAYKSHWY
ncbi:YfjI family protein [Idiomarina ramblicola]|uniref:DUF3987 domain-containing protein n=1 Tax=Idiomarina ramblicola TaxID=263724 RepID=A0A432Z176_9GAMM|nr:YfjI family protein [Idiomarina ramblicola]RUO71637.1 hypothetical protein CWI78_03740 [Idiomarina ramblicola]